MATFSVPLAVAVGVLVRGVAAQIPYQDPIICTGFSDCKRTVPVGPVRANTPPGEMIPCPMQSIAFTVDATFQGVQNANNWIISYGPSWDTGFSVGSDGQLLRCSVYGFTVKSDTAYIVDGALSKIGMYWDGQTLTCLLNGVVTGTISTLPAGPIPCNIKPQIGSTPPSATKAQLWIGGEQCNTGGDYCDNPDGRWFWNGILGNMTLNGIVLTAPVTTTQFPTSSFTTPPFTTPPLPTTSEDATAATDDTETASADATEVTHLYEETTLADGSKVGSVGVPAFATLAGVASLFAALAIVAARAMRPLPHAEEDAARLIEADEELSHRDEPME